MLKIKKQHIRDWNNNIIDEKIIMKHVQSNFNPRIKNRYQNYTFIINSNN